MACNRMAIAPAAQTNKSAVGSDKLQVEEETRVRETTRAGGKSSALLRLCLLLLLATTCCGLQTVAAKTHHSKRQAPQQQQQQSASLSGRENTNWWNLWWQQYINEAVQPTVRPIVAVHFNGQSIELDESARRGEHSLGAREADSSQFEANQDDIERLRLMAASMQQRQPADIRTNSILEPAGSQQRSNWNSVRPTIIKPTQAMRDGQSMDLARQQPASGGANSFGIQMRQPGSARQVSMMDDSLGRFEQQQQSQMLDYSEDSEPEMDNNGGNLTQEQQAQRQPGRVDSSSSAMMQPEEPIPPTRVPAMDARKVDEPKKVMTSRPSVGKDSKQAVDSAATTTSVAPTTSQAPTTLAPRPRENQAPRDEQKTTTTTSSSLSTDSGSISTDETPISINDPAGDQQRTTSKAATTVAGRVELENGRPATPPRPMVMRPAIRLPSVGPTKATTPQMEATSPSRGDQGDSGRTATDQMDQTRVTSIDPMRGQVDIARVQPSGGQVDTQRGQTTEPSRSSKPAGPGQVSTEAPTTTGSTEQSGKPQQVDISTTTRPASSMIPTTRSPSSTMIAGTGSPAPGNETTAAENNNSTEADDESGDEESSDDQSSGNGSGGLMNSAGADGAAEGSDEADEADDGDANDNEVQEPTTTPASPSGASQQPTLGTIELERLPKTPGDQAKAQQASGQPSSDKMQDRANLIMIPLDPTGATSTSALDGETAITVPMETLMRMMMMTRNQLQNMASAEATSPAPLMTTTSAASTTSQQASRTSEATTGSSSSGAEREDEQPTSSSRPEPPKVSTLAPPTTSVNLSEMDNSIGGKKKLQPPPSTRAPGAKMQTAAGQTTTGGEQRVSPAPSDQNNRSGGPVSTVSDQSELLNLDLMPIQRVMQTGGQTSPAGGDANSVGPMTQTNQIKVMMMNNEVNGKAPKGKASADSEAAVVGVEPGMRLRPPNSQPAGQSGGRASSAAPQVTSSSTKSSPLPQTTQTQRAGAKPAMANPNMVYMIMMNGGPTAHSKRPDASLSTATSMAPSTQRASPPRTTFVDVMRQPMTSTSNKPQQTETTVARTSTPSKSTAVPPTTTTQTQRPSSPQRQQQSAGTTAGRASQQPTMTTVAMNTSIGPMSSSSQASTEKQRSSPPVQEATSPSPSSITTTTGAPQTTTAPVRSSSPTSIMTTTTAQTTTTTSEPTAVPKVSATSTQAPAEPSSVSTVDQTSTPSASTSRPPTTVDSKPPSSKLERLQQQPERRPQQQQSLQQQVGGAKTLIIGKSAKAANLTSSFIPSKLRNDFNKLNTRLQPEAQPTTQPPSAVAIRQFGGANRMSVLANQPVPFGRPAAMTMAGANQKAGQLRNLVEPPTFDYGPSIVVRRPDEPLANGQMPNCTLSGKNFCVLAKDYPMNEVRQAVERSFRSVRIMYEELQTVSDQELHKEDFANQTNNQAASGKFACQTQVEMMRPGWAKDEITREWMLVVNTDVFPQRVRTESCAQPNTPCEFIAPFYDSTCQQRYSLHRMIAIDPHDPSRSPQVAVFRFPAGCVCRVHPIKKTTTVAQASSSPLTTRMPTTIISSSTSKSIRRRRR